MTCVEEFDSECADIYGYGKRAFISMYTYISLDDFPNGSLPQLKHTLYVPFSAPCIRHVHSVICLPFSVSHIL